MNYAIQSALLNFQAVSSWINGKSVQWEPYQRKKTVGLNDATKMRNFFSETCQDFLSNFPYKRSQTASNISHVVSQGIKMKWRVRVEPTRSTRSASRTNFVLLQLWQRTTKIFSYVLLGRRVNLSQFQDFCW